MIDVLSVTCPNCQAPVGEACTAADNYSRHPVKRVHGARIQAVHDAQYLPTDAQAPDMSEEFQWDAEVEAEAERRYPFSDGWDGGSYADNARQRICRAAFIDGAQWGSRPF